MDGTRCNGQTGTHEKQEPRTSNARVYLDLCLNAVGLVLLGLGVLNTVVVLLVGQPPSVSR
jgi:hypothetical protein